MADSISLLLQHHQKETAALITTTVDAYVHQMVLWSRDRLRPQLTGWYSRRPWRSIAKGHGPIPSQLFVKVSLP
ncbi:UNVERIFIED_CONTAM: hypothetical protein FKN15_068259 [Acipenser sinensis]